jgi:SAM-dependent methyltransferase
VRTNRGLKSMLEPRNKGRTASVLWIISGPTSVGKSTFIMSHRCAELTGLPPGAPIAWPGLSTNLEHVDLTNVLYHYNILRPLQQQFRLDRAAQRRDAPLPPRSVEFGQDQPWAELLRHGAPKQAVVLLADKGTILDRIRERSTIEAPDLAGRDMASYPNLKWRQVLEPVDLPALYRAWLQELRQHGILYILVDASDDAYRVIPEDECPREMVADSPGSEEPLELPSTPDDAPPSRYSRGEIAQLLRGIGRGYQRIDLPYGLSVNGKDRTETSNLIFPHSLAGKSVLDVGAAQGYFSFEAEARGAERVVAVDLRESRVRDALVLKDIKESAVEFMLRDIVSDPFTEQFDYVLLLNVVHHLREPLRVIRQLASITKERLVIEFPTLADRKFRASLDGTLPRAANSLPLIGVSSMREGIGQTFVFTVSAMRQILQDHEPMFAAVDIIDSPIQGRAIAVCYKVAPGREVTGDPAHCGAERSIRRRGERPRRTRRQG